MQSPSYGVKYQARCIEAIAADTQHTRFLVGTLSLREENEVHIIQLSEHGDLLCESLYVHPPEIWHLAACPFDANIFSTVYASGGEYGASIWKTSARSKGSHPGQLQCLAPLDEHSQEIKCSLWCPNGKSNQLVTIDEENLLIWALDASGKSAKVQGRLSPGSLHHMNGGCWDPHDIASIAIKCESSVQFWDLRSSKLTNTIEQAHAFQVRDINYNPRRPHVIATAGEDSKIRIWDLRNADLPLLELQGHSHWTWRILFNPLHEELMLSSGTDSVVNLWHVNCFSTEGEEPRSPTGSPRSPLDQLLRSHHEHEDSIYGIAWSSKDPWMFASMSYDGRIFIDSVPQATRRKLKLK